MRKISESLDLLVIFLMMALILLMAGLDPKSDMDLEEYRDLPIDPKFQDPGTDPTLQPDPSETFIDPLGDPHKTYIASSRTLYQEPIHPGPDPRPSRRFPGLGPSRKITLTPTTHS